MTCQKFTGASGARNDSCSVRSSEKRDSAKKTGAGIVPSTRSAACSATLQVSHGRQVRPGVDEATTCTRCAKSTTHSSQSAAQ